MSMSHSVPLARIPDGFRIPVDLADRLHYDDGRRRLAFDGFMSKADFDRLYLLSQDWTYRRALEDLFRECTDAENGPRRGLAGRLRALMGGLGLL